jgi:hypothetical protein
MGDETIGVGLMVKAAHFALGIDIHDIGIVWVVIWVEE